MPYDLFISYSRRDNEQGRITQLVERIKADFAPFAKRELVPFFDQQGNCRDARLAASASCKASANRACCSPAFPRRISRASIAGGSLSNTSNTKSATSRLQRRRADLLR